MKPLVKARKSWIRWLSLVFFLLIVLCWWINLPGYWAREFAQRSLQRHEAHDALNWIDTALVFHRNDSRAMVLAVRAHLQLNLNAKANEWLDRAKAMGAEESTTKPLRYLIAAQLGNMDAAEQLLSDPSLADLPSEANEAVIRAFQYGNLFQRVDLMLDYLDKDSQTRSIVPYQRGRLCEIRDDIQNAGRFYAEALKLQPSSSRAAFRAGVCFRNSRDFDRAEECFRKNGSSLFQSVFAIEIANCLWEKNAAEQAFKIIEPYLELRPKQTRLDYIQLDEFIDSDRVAIVAARIEDALEHRERAVLLLKRALAFNHRDVKGRALLIRNLKALGRNQEADEAVKVQSQMILDRQRCRDLRDELEKSPFDSKRMCELAELYWKVETDAEALLTVSEILAKEPKCERAVQLQATIQLERQKSD
jgi:tetratricopeptide (TPR) repeat protein